MAANSALVLFSGGQDSTVCLAWALDRYAHVETIGFAYGQRHAVELAQRPIIRQSIAATFPRGPPASATTTCSTSPTLGQISDTALTRDAAVRDDRCGPAQHLRARPQLAVLHLRRRSRLSPRHPHAHRRHVRDGFLRLPRLPQRHAAIAGKIHLARHGCRIHDRDPADVDRQGRHLGHGREIGRRRRSSTSSSSTPTRATPQTAPHATPGATAAAHARPASCRAKGWEKWQTVRS